MPLNLGTGSLKDFVKYNSKADKWFVAGDQEIARPTFAADFWRMIMQPRNQSRSRPSTRAAELWDKVLARYGVPITPQARGWAKVLARFNPPNPCSCNKP